MKQKVIWLISFISPFVLGFIIILIYTYFKDNFTLKSLLLNDWMNYFAASGTIGAFLSLIIDKISNDKNENHKKWQSEIPVITLTSPCDPTSNYCDINIVNFNADFEERGSQYFSIINIGKTNAYNIKIEFSSEQNFNESNIFHRHYIPYLIPIVTTENKTSFQDYIYSKFAINPDTKEITNKKFEICGCLDDCKISTTNSDEKYFYVKISYNSSLAKDNTHIISTYLRINLICEKSQIKEVDQYVNIVKIKGITILDYEYK